MFCNSSLENSFSGSKIFTSQKKANSKGSGRVTARELMPLLATREFRKTSSSTVCEARKAGNVCQYRNGLNELTLKLTEHHAPERSFVGGDEECHVDGKFMPPQEVLHWQILLYDARGAFKPLPRRSGFHDWAKVFDGTPIYGTSLESFTLTPRSVVNTQSVIHIENFSRFAFLLTW